MLVVVVVVLIKTPVTSTPLSHQFLIPSSTTYQQSYWPLSSSSSPSNHWMCWKLSMIPSSPTPRQEIPTTTNHEEWSLLALLLDRPWETQCILWLTSQYSIEDMAGRIILVTLLCFLHHLPWLSGISPSSSRALSRHHRPHRLLQDHLLLLHVSIEQSEELFLRRRDSPRKRWTIFSSTSSKKRSSISFLSTTAYTSTPPQLLSKRHENKSN